MATLDLAGVDKTLPDGTVFTTTYLSGANNVTNTGVGFGSGTTINNLSEGGGPAGATPFTGIISDGSSFGATGVVHLVHTSGTTRINSASSYSGGTTIQAGILQIGVANALGTGAVNFFAGAGGGTLEDTGFFGSLSNAINIGSGSSATIGATAGQALILSGGFSNFGGAGTTLHFGSATDTGIVSLANSTQSITPGGAITIDGGTLALGNASNATAVVGGAATFAVGTAATFNLNGFSGTVNNLSGLGTVTNAGSAFATLSVVDSVNTSFSGILSNGAGSGVLALATYGSGTLALNGANTYSGGTTLNGGKLQIGGMSALGTGTVTFATSTLESTVSGILANAIVVLSSFTATIGAAANQTLTLTGTLSDASALHFGSATDAGKVVLATSGTSAAASSTLAVDGGILALGSASAYSLVNTMTTNGITVGSATGATLEAATSGTISTKININSGSSATFGAANGQTLTLNPSYFSENGGAGTTLHFGSASDTGTVAVGFVVGNSSLATAIAIDGGTVKLTTANGLGFFLGFASSVLVNGTFDLGGFNSGANNLTGSGIITNSGAAASTLTTSNAAATTFSGTLQNGVGTLALVEGGGALTLTGASTYTGGTSITAGTLSLAGGGSIAASQSVSLSAGTTFDISAVSGSGASINRLSNLGTVTLGGKALTVNNQAADIGGTFTGSAGTDGLIVNLAAAAASFSLANATFTNWTDGTDQLVVNGNALNNLLIGSAAHNTTLNGGGGSDTITYAGLTGGATINATITNGAGSVVKGGTTTDTLTSIESLVGSSHSDTFKVVGALTIDGAAGGGDTVDTSGNTAGVTVTMTAGAGTIVTGAGTATLTSIEQIIGTGFNDNFFVDNSEQIDGGAGFNTLVEKSSGVTFNLGDANHLRIQEVVLGGGINVVGIAAGDSDFTYLYGGGSGSTDTLTTGVGGGYLISTGGTNHMTGGAATNVFIGGAGTSDMHGGSGANVYYVGANDTVAGAGTYNTLVELAAGVTLNIGANDVQQVILNGGTNSVDMTGSTDFVYLYGGAAGSTNTLTTGAGGGYELSTGGTNHMFGGSGPTVFVGGVGSNDMHGGSGVNTYYVGATDTVAGAGVYNTLIELASSVNLTLGGAGLSGVQQFILNSGNNILNASSATTQLIVYGGAGNDTFKGGTGNDYFYGGLGSNTLAVGAGWGQDTIQDWTAGTNNHIDMTALAASGVHSMANLTVSVVGGNDVIAFGGNTITLNGFAGTLSAGNFIFA